VNIVWFSWKDRKHPLAGGAEVISGEIMDRLVRDGHAVQMITARYPGSSDSDLINGVRIIRTGNRYSVYLRARQIYRSQFASWADVVIDEMNTIPFGCAYYSKTRSFLFVHQLARQIWFYEIGFPLSIIGYLFEPLYLRLLAKKYERVLTVSNSTRTDLMRYGFPPARIDVIHEGIGLRPVAAVDGDKPRDLVLCLGAVRPMKRTLDAIRAFEAARDLRPGLSLVIAGDACSAYAEKVANNVRRSRHRNGVSMRGRVSGEERQWLMRQASVVLVTSVKEGWGLVVTEANSQGTPAIVYDVDGLRDSVQNGKTGVVVANNDHRAMGHAIVELLKDSKRYAVLQESAWQWSKEFTFEACYEDFVRSITDGSSRSIFWTSDQVAQFGE
jgi:glycosyltransferase involved in cell wall biosynthesis